MHPPVRPSPPGVDRLGLGCVKLGGARTRAGEERMVALVREAVDLGVRSFDTADAYNSGLSEATLGRALGRHRNDVVVATKGGYLFDQAPVNGIAARTVPRFVGGVARRLRPGGQRRYQRQDFSADYLRHAVDASLRRLGTDHIDIYQLHAPPAVCGEEAIATLCELVRLGKIGEIGVGFESIRTAGEWLKIHAVTRLQIPFGMLDPEARSSLLAAATGRGVGIMVRGVLASGLLNSDQSGFGTYIRPEKMALLRQLRSVASDAGVAIETLALSWVLAQPMAGLAIVGINSSTHLHAAVAAASNPLLDSEVLAKVDHLLDEYLSRPVDA